MLIIIILKMWAVWTCFFLPRSVFACWYFSFSAQRTSTLFLERTFFKDLFLLWVLSKKKYGIWLIQIFVKVRLLGGDIKENESQRERFGKICFF